MDPDQEHYRLAKGRLDGIAGCSCLVVLFIVAGIASALALSMGLTG